MIYAKLLAFAEKGITVEKDAKNPFFKSEYTTLNEVLEKVQPVLNELKVVVTQQGVVDQGQAGLITILTDTEDDTKVCSFFPFVGLTDAQKLGANISYIRRYALISLLGLRSEDDDAESAVRGSTAPKKATRGVQDAEGDPLAGEFKI